MLLDEYLYKRADQHGDPEQNARSGSVYRHLQNPHSHSQAGDYRHLPRILREQSGIAVIPTARRLTDQKCYSLTGPGARFSVCGRRR